VLLDRGRRGLALEDFDISGIGHIGPKTSVKLLRPVTDPRGLERRLNV
jgi:hypothetical protein